MDLAIYILLGTLDIFVVSTFAFALYKQPYKEYLKELILASVVISILSYITRVIFKMPLVDSLIQFTTFILIFRYVLVYRIKDSLKLAGTGFIYFVVSQLAIFKLFVFLGIGLETDAQSTSNFGTYLIQISNQIWILFSAIIVKIFDYSFASISRPPQWIRANKKEPMGWYTVMLGIAVIICNVSIVVITKGINNVGIIIIVGFVSFVFLLRLTYKRESSHDGMHSSKHSVLANKKK
ncbi:hypothetical protein [Paenibacillus mesotrionivorans]|uniref:Uncharacterized protein n=1 Tax=Paenibacillus mesotrionivorans TaxID=3160968 RepID=A0ACC7NWE2_9BACL